MMKDCTYSGFHHRTQEMEKQQDQERQGGAMRIRPRNQ
jgi:hypothetical protein